MAAMLKKSIIFSKFFFISMTTWVSLEMAPAASFAQTQDQEKELFLLAQKSFEDGFYDIAMNFIDQLFKTYPDTTRGVEANLLLGQCYFFKSQYLKAYEIFQNLLKSTELKDATLFWLGETYLKGADYQQAEKQHQQLVEVYPNSIYTPQAYYSLGWNYFEQNKFEKAKESFLKMIKLFPTHELTEDAAFKLGECEYNLHLYPQTIQHYTNYLHDFPQSTRQAETYFYIAESYYYTEDFLTAIAYYAKTAEMSYDNKLILMGKVSMGWSYLKLGKFKLAQDHFDEALRFSEEKGILSDDVYLGQASVYTESKEYDKALKAYFQLIENFPKSQRLADGYLGVANIFYILKRYPDAIQRYQKIIDQFSTDLSRQEILEKAYFGLAWSYLKAGDIDLCVKSFESINEHTSNKTVKISALTQIGDAYQDVDQLEKAVEVYDRILNDYPDSPYTDYVQYRQGIALLKMDRIESATLSFQSLQANFPGSKYLSDIKYYLAVAYFKKGDWTTAHEQIEEFLSDSLLNHELEAEAYHIMALSLFNLNAYDEAIKTFQKILKNFPEESSMVKNAEIGIAKSFYKMGDIAEALKRFKMIMNTYPNSDVEQEAILWLAEHYLGASEFDTAIGYYSQFIEKFPGSEKINVVYYQVAEAYQAKEEYDQAVHFYKQIKSSADRLLYAKAELAIADIFSKELSPESAVETYQNIISISPEFARDAYVKIAEVYKKSKQYNPAIEAYKQALQSDKVSSQWQNVELQFHIADTYELASQPERALEEYLKIPYLYTNETSWIVKAYLRIGRIFEEEDNWEEAKSIYKKIIQFQTEESKFAQEHLDWINENIVEQKP